MQLEINQRAAVVAAARSWIGTPYHPAARKKGVGVDCLTFIVEVFEEAGLIPRQELPVYSRMWHLAHEEERYMGAITRYCREFTPLDHAPSAGDLMLVKVGKAFAHGVIILDWPDVAHALMGRGVILTSARNDGDLIGRPRRFFSFWENS